MVVDRWLPYDKGHAAIHGQDGRADTARVPHDERPPDRGICGRARTGGRAAIETCRWQLPTSNSQLPKTSSSDLVRLDALALSKAIHTKKVSCREVMVAFLDHIDRVNPHVNAIVSLQDRESLLNQADERDRQLARGASAGWMHAFPHAVKRIGSISGGQFTEGPLCDPGSPSRWRGPTPPPPFARRAGRSSAA